MAYYSSKNGLPATNGHSPSPSKALQLPASGAFQSGFGSLPASTLGVSATVGVRCEPVDRTPRHRTKATPAIAYEIGRETQTTASLRLFVSSLVTAPPAEPGASGM
jgi:hypothetical protein